MIDELISIFAKTKSDAWVGLLGVTIGAFISILGIWLTNHTSVKQLLIQLNNDKNVRSSELKREKLEELYVLVDKWLNVMVSDYLMLSLVMKGKINYNQYLDKVIENGDKQNLDFSRFQMIVDMYSHDLETDYQKLMAARDDINKITYTHKCAYKSGDIEGEKFLRPYNIAIKNLEKIGSSFKKEIAEYAKRT